MNRLNGNAFLVHVEQHETDAIMFGSVWVGSNQSKHPIGVLSAGCPGFLSVDDKMVTLQDRFGLQSRQVRSCAGLTVSLAPSD